MAATAPHSELRAALCSGCSPTQLRAQTVGTDVAPSVALVGDRGLRRAEWACR